MITESAIERLKSKGIRPSMQRIAIMDYLLKHRTHPTVEQIFADLLPSMPTLSRTTVYNTLKRLCDEGVVRTLDIDNQQSRYDGDISLHAHFRCSVCGRIDDVKIDNDQMFEMYCPKNAQIDDIQLYYRGVCDCCKKFND